MADLPTPVEAMSLWTFGRETPVDGDLMAVRLHFQRLTHRLAVSWVMTGSPLGDVEIRRQDHG